MSKLVYSKKITPRFCLLASSLFLWATSLPAQNKPLVVASASIFADMAENLAGAFVDIQTVVPIGGDPHIYEPTPADAQLATKADLILINGLTFEGWLNEMIANSGTKAKIVTITEGIMPIESEKYKNSTDPHAWMDAYHGLTYINNIRLALKELVPEHAEAIDFNYEVYRQQLEDMDAFIRQEIQKIPEKQRILITSHDAFRYYARRYGIKVEAILGTSTDAEAQTSDIQRLNKVIRENQVPAVFIETTVNPRLLKQIATDNHIIIGGQLYSDSIGDKDSPAPSYLDMLRYNTNTIVAALSKQKEPEKVSDNGSAKSNVWWYLILGLALVAGFFLVAKKLNG
ncbi:MAG TPA: zinc ABC transporter substrate-binding protein [Saprospiraceae bacterium]|nr:zinc ABC transporter substrate-binding protein [Saprospiraceae bacterium]HMQ81849.1 zinc ABC transporter substrate-binding protein [Saprospiraceae bacterium]